MSVSTGGHGERDADHTCHFPCGNKVPYGRASSLCSLSNECAQDGIPALIFVCSMGFPLFAHCLLIGVHRMA